MGGGALDVAGDHLLLHQDADLIRFPTVEQHHSGAARQQRLYRRYAEIMGAAQPFDLGHRCRQVDDPAHECRPSPPKGKGAKAAPLLTAPDL